MTTNPYAVGSIERVFRILIELEIAPGARLADLAKRVDSNPTTTLRSLRVLEAGGFVRRTPADGYVLGPRLIELGYAAARAVNVGDELAAELTELSRQHNVTAHVGTLRDGMVTVVGKIDPPMPLVRYSTLGTRMPLHATAAGKAVLALLEKLGDPIDITTIDLRLYTPNSIQDRGALVTEIEATRHRRFSIESGEYQMGFSCVGTAIRVNDELYTLSLSGPQAQGPLLAARGKALIDVATSFVDRHATTADTL